MPYMSLATAEQIEPTLQFKNDAERAAWAQAKQQAKGEAIRKGTQMLSDSAQRLSDDSEAWSAEAIAITDGFEAVAREAANPVSDFRAVLKVSQDLEARAKVLAVWKDQLRERMTAHNERVADPVALYEEFTTKWANRSLSNRDRFLHSFPQVG